VCHFDASKDWFISKMLKDGLRSTVTSVAWCPNNKFVIAGSTDFKARIYSAYIEGIDSAEDDGFGEVFPKQHEFGEVLAEFDQAKAWVNTVSWSPGGFRVAFSGHGSTMHFVQLLAGSAPIVQTVYLDGLPYMDADFVGDGCVVAAGYDRNPHIFGVTGGSDTEPQWGLIDEVDKKDAKAAAAAPAKTENKMLAARAAFATAGPGQERRRSGVNRQGRDGHQHRPPKHHRQPAGDPASERQRHVVQLCGSGRPHHHLGPQDQEAVRPRQTQAHVANRSAGTAEASRRANLVN